MLTLPVSINQFEDAVTPVPKMYLPLTSQQIAAGSTDTAVQARRKNESLTVKATTGADTTSKVGLAKAAYDARQVILDALPNEITLANKLVDPRRWVCCACGG